MNPKIILFVRQLNFAAQYFDKVLAGLSVKFDIIVLHTSKLENVTPTNSAFINKDISYWSHKRLNNFLMETAPKTCLVTNIRSLLDIYFFSVCNTLNIELTFIEHGLTLNKITKFKGNNKIQAVRKYLFYCLKVIGFVTSSGKPLQNLKSITKALLHSDYSNITLTKALFFTKSSKQILSNFFDLGNTKISYSGYPVVEKKRELEILKGIHPKKQIVYIHQPLIQDSFSKLTFNEEIDLLKKIDKIIKKEGYNFIIKLHPRDNYMEYRSSLGEINVADQDQDLNQLIGESEIILGHFSTALLTAIFLKRKLFVLDFWKITNDLNNQFKDGAVEIKSLDQLEAKLKYADTCNSNHSVIDSSSDSLIGEHNTHEHRLKSLIDLVDATT